MKMGTMDILMELYETFYQAALHPEQVQFSYQPILPLFTRLCKLAPSPKAAYQMLLIVWDQAIEDSAKEQSYRRIETSVRKDTGSYVFATNQKKGTRQ